MAGYIGSKVAVVSSGAERKKVFTATSGQTSFTGLSYTVNNVHVFQNGVRLVDGTDYTATNGNSITLTVGAATDDQVVVVSYNTFQTSDTVSASTGGTFAGDVSFTGAFTSQGIDDNATSTAMTLDSSGNLLVGHSGSIYNNINTTSTVGSSYSSNGEIFACSDQSSGVMFLNRKTTDGAIATFRKDGSTVGSIQSRSGVVSTIVLNPAGTDGAGLTGGTDTVAPTNGLGTITNGDLDLGFDNGKFRDIYLSGGVYLGGTGSANKLSDVEEGDWIPTFGLSTTDPDSVVYNTAVTGGFYRKIGNYVFVSGTLYTSGVTIGSGAGTLQIGNLPFVVANSSQGQNAYSSLYIGEAGGFSGHHPSSGRFIQSNTAINLFYRTSANGGSLSNNGNDLNTGVNKNLLRFSGSYTT